MAEGLRRDLKAPPEGLLWMDRHGALATSRQAGEDSSKRDLYRSIGPHFRMRLLVSQAAADDLR